MSLAAKAHGAFSEPARGYGGARKYFRLEEFHAISHGDKLAFPKWEMLFVPGKGQNAETFFEQANQSTLETILSLGLRLAARLNGDVSLNVDPISMGAPNFLDTVARSSELFPDAQRPYLEITERGSAFPEDKKKWDRILSTIKGMGYRLALDDFELLEDHESRLGTFAPYLDAIKFSHHVMMKIRGGGIHAKEYLDAITRLSNQHPDAVMVMEGITLSDHGHHATLRNAGIDFVQIYTPPEQELVAFPAQKFAP